MHLLRKFYFLLLLITSFSLQSQTKVKTMFYNLLNYDGGPESNSRTTHLKTILENVQPDLFLVCELKDEIGSNYLFNNAVLPTNKNFKKADFKISAKNPSLLQTAYYNSKKLILENTDVIATDLRDINHYTFKLNTETSIENPIYFEVFVTHLKASTGYSNRLRRLTSIQDFVNQLNRIPSDRHVLFAGDFNFYSSNEEGYQFLIDDRNPIVMVDPIDRPNQEFPNNPNINDPFDFYSSSANYFWRNSSYADIHSQSTRTFSLNGDGAGGGMDDRFDFIMMSDNFNSNTDLYYIPNSYKTVGNNGNCYNLAVNNSDCSGDFAQNLREALYQFSDHLPIVMEVETPQNTLSNKTYRNRIAIISSTIVKDQLIYKTSKKIKIIEIYNQLGQKVFSQKKLEEGKKEINLAYLSKGLYYLKTGNYKPLKFLKI